MSSTARWTQSYDQGVPATLGPDAYGQETVLDVLERQARDNAKAVALLFKGRAITYGELWGEGLRLAEGLRQAGMQRGETVALLLPNCPQFVIAEIAVWMLGGRIAPMNPSYPPEELGALLSRVGATRAIVLSLFYKTVKAVQAKTTLRQIVVTSIKDYLPLPLWVGFTIKDHVGLPEKVTAQGGAEATKKWVWKRQQGHLVQLEAGDARFRGLIRQGANGLQERTAVRSHDIATVLPSGGTTGTPKGVLGRHLAIVAAGRQLEAWLGSVLTPGQDVIMLPLPLFHVYGCVGVQGLAFVGGRTLALIPDPRNTDDIVKAIEQVRPTLFTAVPALFTALLAHKRVQAGAADFSSVRLSFSGSAPLMRDTQERFEAVTKGRIIEGYSLTEGQMAVLAGPVGATWRPGSIGMPLPDVEVLLVHPEHGETPVADGETGEMVIRAPQITSGYLNQPEETANLLRTHSDGSVWMYTGDLARMDAEGFFYLVDRKKDLIKAAGGFQVWPTEIEQVVATHPSVQEVGVAGVPNGDRGDIVAVWIVLREGQSAPSLAEIKTHCREHLAPYKAPSRLYVVPALPKSPIGKILRRELSKMAAAEG